MDSPVTCRPLDAADMAMVIALSYRIWPVAYAGVLTAEQIENILARIYNAENLAAELAAGHRFWAAEEGGVALGFVSAYRDGETIWVKKIYILPQCQGRGVGRLLMDTAIAAFLPASEVRLLVNGGNLSAQRFYERCGFTRAHTVPVRMGDFDFTDYVYRRIIPPM